MNAGVLFICSIDRTHTRLYMKTVVGSDKSAITYGSCALKNGATFPFYGAIQICALVKIHACKIQFTQIARIVHVVEQPIDVVGEAETCGKINNEFL